MLNDLGGLISGEFNIMIHHGNPSDQQSGEPIALEAQLEAAASVEAILFEDILDIEGPLRQALAAGDGACAVSLGSLETNLEAMAGRIPADAFDLLQVQLRAMHSADDVGALARSRADMVETLTALRRTIA